MYRMESMITRRVTAPDAAFDACYRLMQATFPADELVDREEYELLLQAPQRHTHPHWFVMLSHWDGDSLAGMIAGSYMVLEAYPSESIGMIEYLAVAEAYRGKRGHGRALLQAFEGALGEIASQRGETLFAVVGEVEHEILPFKFRAGYWLAEGLWYAQPPIAFDAQGEPLFAPVEKHLAIRLTAYPHPEYIESARVRAIVSTLYHWRYVPITASAAAVERAQAYIETEVFAQVRASTGTRAALRLHQDHAD